VTTQELADALDGTQQNVYGLAARNGMECGDGLFESLWSQAGLFKCSECNVWTRGNPGPAEPPLTCGECLSHQEEDDEED
jgi:hypothetical protein